MNAFPSRICTYSVLAMDWLERASATLDCGVSAETQLDRAILLKIAHGEELPAPCRGLLHATSIITLLYIKHQRAEISLNRTRRVSQLPFFCEVFGCGIADWSIHHLISISCCLVHSKHASTTFSKLYSTYVQVSRTYCTVLLRHLYWSRHASCSDKRVAKYLLTELLSIFLLIALYSSRFACL